MKKIRASRSEFISQAYKCYFTPDSTTESPKASPVAATTANTAVPPKAKPVAKPNLLDAAENLLNKGKQDELKFASKDKQVSLIFLG